MNKKNIIVLGGGITGLTFIKFFRGNASLFEKENNVGGLLKSYKFSSSKGNFIFDTGGHWFHSKKSEKLQTIFSNLQGHKRFSFVSLFNKLLDYPLQSNFKQLENIDIINQINYDIKNNIEIDSDYKNYDDMLLKRYGKTLYFLFFREYNKKLLGIDDLTKIECGDYDIIRNISLDDKVGYNHDFTYPTNGKGIISLIDELKTGMPYNLNKEVCYIDPCHKYIMFKDGTMEKYDILVSTIPLNKLTIALNDSFKKIKLYGKLLKHSTGVLYNLGVKKNLFHLNKSWIYYSDKDLPFYRVGFYSNIDKDMSPKDHSSIYVECNSINKQSFNNIVKGLIQEKIINDKKDIIVSQKIKLKNNYPYSSKFSELIKQELEILDIHSIGRYGSWKWLSMHECMLEAIDLAKKLK